MRLAVALVWLLALWLVACDRGGQDPNSSLGVDVLRDVGIEQKLGAQLPLDASFVDEGGKEVVLGDYFGERPVVLALVYAECPMLCSAVLSGLNGALRTLELSAGRDFDVLAVSFDPREGPKHAAAQKARFVKRYDRAGGEAGFHFLTGDEVSIRRLTEAVGFRYVYDPELEQYAHAGAVMVITPAGAVARYFYGSEYPPRDLRLAMVEASAGKLGRLSDELMLLCYRYDPATGSYAASAVGAIRIGGLLTILSLGGFFVSSLRRERRRRQEAAL